MRFERECTESYYEGHVRAFEFFGGVPSRITYDNSRVLVSKIIGSHEQSLTQGFFETAKPLSFQRAFLPGGPYQFVEGIEKYSRLNYFVPVPEVCNLE